MTTFVKPLRVRGNWRDDNAGDVLVHQTVNIPQNGASAVTVPIPVPANARLIDVIVDPVVSFNSATSATLSIGSAPAGTQYVSGVDAKGTARARPTFTQAQLTAMRDVGDPEGSGTATLYATITPVGATTLGSVDVTIVYRA